MNFEGTNKQLIQVIDRHAELAIAVSGGVDSMVLAYMAHRYANASIRVFHAISPAVPRVATERVKRYSDSYGWQLQLIDAGELVNESYRSNPVDRCFYCKSSLYGRIRSITNLQIASGTNIDDLSDYRPGLRAADIHNVLHPFVEAGLSKSSIYTLAEEHRLYDLASLPAQPCLASRIETGTRVDAGSLRLVESIEILVQESLPAIETLRCRITSRGVFLECFPLPSVSQQQQVNAEIARFCSEFGLIYGGFRAYRRGSAFLIKECRA